MVVSFEQDMMNFPVAETPTLIISALCSWGKSKSPLTIFPVPSVFFWTLKTLILLPFDRAEINALQNILNTFYVGKIPYSNRLYMGSICWIGEVKNKYILYGIIGNLISVNIIKYSAYYQLFEKIIDEFTLHLE